jgi:hypothetical protein
LNYSDSITVSYIDGSIKTSEGLELVPFMNYRVENLIQDPAPFVVQTRTTFLGDSVIVQFNKKMKSPDAHVNTFQLMKNSVSDIPIQSVSLDSYDSSKFIFITNAEIYFEDSIMLSYSGTALLSADEYALKPFAALLVTNMSSGYPPVLINGFLEKNDTVWDMIILKFDRQLSDVNEQKEYFSLSINNENAVINTLTGSYDTIVLYFNPPTVYGDEVKIGYSGGSIKSINNGLLEEFADFSIQNLIPFPLSNHGIVPINTISTYFSPGKDEINVISGVGFNRIVIYDTGGRLIFEKHYDQYINAASMRIKLNKGVYLIKIFNETSSTDVKIVI